MSIIYEALKKVEQSGVGVKKPVAEVRSKPEKKIINFKAILISCLIAAIGIFLAKSLFEFISRPPAAVKQVVSVVAPVSGAGQKAAPSVSAPQAAAQAQPAFSGSALTLNGVFYSGDEAYALLNNQITRVGDVVDGALVKRISLEGVELEKDGQLIQVPAAK